MRDAVLARVHALPAPSAELVELLSLAPAGLEIGIAEAVVEAPALAADAAVVAGLIEADAGRLRFRHETAGIEHERVVRTRFVCFNFG